MNAPILPFVQATIIYPCEDVRPDCPVLAVVKDQAGHYFLTKGDEEYVEIDSFFVLLYSFGKRCNLCEERERKP